MRGSYPCVMLILFDIDATLISTGGAGVRAIVAAARELHGEQITDTGLEYAGRIDPLIVGDLLRMNGVEASPAVVAALRGAYERHLKDVLKEWPQREALPGVHALIDALGAERGVTLGLLTGNYQQTGLYKLRACGIDESRFAISVWGDDSPHVPPSRDHLPEVAMKRYAKYRGGLSIGGERVVVIGDTPHDVRCAHAHGCRALGVATGRFSVADLEQAGADWAVKDLSETEAVVGWLMGRGRGDRAAGRG